MGEDVTRRVQCAAWGDLDVFNLTFVDYGPSVYEGKEELSSLRLENEHYVVDPDARPVPDGKTVWVEVPADDADRWTEAANEFIRTHDALVKRMETLGSGPLVGLSRPKRVLWKVRRRSQVMFGGHQARWRRLLHDFSAAYRLYDEQTADLQPLVRLELERMEEREREEQQRHEEQRQQREEKRRQRQQERRQQKREREQREKLRRAAAIRGPASRMWACRLDVTDGRRIFFIWLPALDELWQKPDRLLSGVTAKRIQKALEHERATHPSTGVRWGTETRRALIDFRGNVLAGWKELTGVRIRQNPVSHEEKHRPSRYGYGPSSNYTSYDSGGSYSSGSW